MGAIVAQRGGYVHPPGAARSQGWTLRSEHR